MLDSGSSIYLLRSTKKGCFRILLKCTLLNFGLPKGEFGGTHCKAVWQSRISNNQGVTLIHPLLG